MVTVTSYGGSFLVAMCILASVVISVLLLKAYKKCGLDEITKDDWYKIAFSSAVISAVIIIGMFWFYQT